MLVPVDSCQADRMLCYPSPMCAPCGPVCANITAEGMVDMCGNTNTKIWTNKNNSNYCDVPRSICGPNPCAPCGPCGPAGPVCANITAEGTVDACGNTNTKIWTNKNNSSYCGPNACGPNPCVPCGPCGPAGAVCANITAEGTVDACGNTNTKIWTNKNNSSYCGPNSCLPCGPNPCAPCGPCGPAGPVCASITAEGTVDACGNTNTKIWTNKLNGSGCPPAMCNPCAPVCAPVCAPACPPVCGPGPPVRASITAEAAVDACGNTNTKIWVNKNNDAGGCFPCADPCGPPICLPICPPSNYSQAICGRRNGLDPTYAEMRGARKFDYYPCNTLIPPLPRERCTKFPFYDIMSNASIPGYTPRQHCPKNIPEKRVNRYKACVNRRDGMQDKCDPLTKKAFRNSCFKRTC